MINKLILLSLIGVVSNAKQETIPISVQSVLLSDSLGTRSLKFEKWVKANSIGYDSSEYEYLWSNEIYIYKNRKIEYQKCKEFMCGALRQNTDSIKSIYGNATYFKVLIFHNVVGSSWVSKGKIGEIKWEPQPALLSDTTEIISIEKDNRYLGSMPVQIGWSCISVSEIKK